LLHVQISHAYKTTLDLLRFYVKVTTLCSPYSKSHPSVICDVRAPCTDGWTFCQYFCTT